jgi:putative FmdB family regulatory protein
MPIYEYQCRACEHAFETIQRMNEPVLTECPDCGEDQLKKLVSAAAFRLKGSGWYETDFKSGNQKNVVKADDKGGSESASRDNSDSSDNSANKADRANSDSSAKSDTAKETSKPAKSGTGDAKPKGDSKSANG